MRYGTGAQITEPELMGRGLPNAKAGFFTKELSFFLLTLAGFAAMVAMLWVAG